MAIPRRETVRSAEGLLQGAWSRSDRIGRTDDRDRTNNDGKARRSGAILAIVTALITMVLAVCETGNAYEIPWNATQFNSWWHPLPQVRKLETSASYDFDSPSYQVNHDGKRHTGIDIHANPDTGVHAIADGVVAHIVRSADPSSMVVILEHESSRGPFFCVYGHVSPEQSLELGDSVLGGELIGSVRESGSPCHLHFGINTSGSVSDFLDSLQGRGWGRTAPTSATEPAIDPRDVGWVDPLWYLPVSESVSRGFSPCELLAGWGIPSLEAATEAAHVGHEIYRWSVGQVDQFPYPSKPCYEQATNPKWVFMDQFGDVDIRVEMRTPLGLIQALFAGRSSSDPDDPSEIQTAIEETSCRLGLTFCPGYVTDENEEGLWADGARLNLGSAFPHGEIPSFFVRQDSITLRVDAWQRYPGYGRYTLDLPISSLDTMRPFEIAVEYASVTFAVEIDPLSLQCP